MSLGPLAVGLVMVLAAVPLAAQAPETPSPRILTLEDALALAEDTSEQVAIAAAGVARAEAGRQLAQSEGRPQLGGAASYDRTLKSEFEGVFDEGFGGGEGGDFSDLPFGQSNVYRLGLSFSQLLYSGGRVDAQVRQAGLRAEHAGTSLLSSKAQALLDVAGAYYDAALADRVVDIAEETYAQADRSLTQTTAQRAAGRVSEFELLRARVARDTLAPEVVRARAARDVAYLRLKQLLDLPLQQPLALDAGLEAATLEPPSRFAAPLAEAEAGLAAAERLAVTQSQNDVQVAEEGVTVARSQRKPSIALRSDYGLVNYPSRLPAFDDWRTNWTVGAAVTLPILTGGRLAAEEAAARAAVTEAQARLRLTRELAALERETVRQELRAARAEWEASASAITEAARAYEIAELRNREGLSTQLEISDSRLLLAQSQVTRARAARNLQVQRIRLALLPSLPLSGAAAPAGAAAAPAATGRTQTATTAPGAGAAGTNGQGGR